MIYVVGVGFVGLTTALGFAKKNFIVTAVENNNKKIKLLTQNKITFDEPFLKENLKNIKHQYNNKERSYEFAVNKEKEWKKS